MSIEQVATGTESLTPSSPASIYARAGAGGAVVLLSLRDMASTDTLVMRHWLTFPGEGNTVVASREIEHSATTDETWVGTAGGTDAQGWQSWPLGFGDAGGFVELESTSGSYDVEWVVLDLGGPTG